MPESDETFERKFEEWQARNWPDWLAKHLTFPFTVIREDDEDDEDDAIFAPGAAKALFRLGHKSWISRSPPAEPLTGTRRLCAFADIDQTGSL